MYVYMYYIAKWPGSAGATALTSQMQVSFYIDIDRYIFIYIYIYI